ncbi:transcriptional factor nfil3:e4bp4 [Echinococcus multilocularis]|uniref:Transcriptional factor nfil3:e4bp4 n=1 Tax=Echinococcus multilocularis TaxID=6211 RepID=A0A068YP41_ECHMU|nr:transcriptional factor nfil3:e4bp4 [Echinococcus multilocularis]
MGELAVTDLGAGPSSTDSPHSSPSSSIIPPVSSTFLYNSMISVKHGTSPPPPNLEEEEDEDEGEGTMEGDVCASFYRPGETRKAREFIPECKKDEKYWERRRKNNEAAKRSREKRRQNDALMEQEIAELKQQNEVLIRENAALVRELTALKAKKGGGVLGTLPPQPPPQLQTLPTQSSTMPPAVNALDLLALQRLLSAFTNNSNGVAARPAPTSNTAGSVEDSPLDLSGRKIAMLQQNCISHPSPIPQSTLPPVSDVDQFGKLTELAVLTSTSPQAALEGSYNANRPQSCSWNTTPNPITPPACTGLQALISAAALTASPLISDGANADNHATPSWDLHQLSPCLPLGLQPLPQQRIETPNEPTRRRNGNIRSPPSQYDDERYRERRRKNNEAVRRCRENKRARLSMRDEVTGRLESDNTLLRLKLDGLNSEVRALRHLLLAGQQQIVVPQAVKDEPQPKVENTPCSIESKPQPDAVEVKPPPKYALPKKGIPRVPNSDSHLPPLKRRITLPPPFNPLAGTAGSGIAVPIEGTSSATD